MASRSGRVGRRDAVRERDQLREILDQIETVRIDRSSSTATLLPAMRAALEADAVVMYSLREADREGWRIARFEHSDQAATDGFVEQLDRFFVSAPRRFAWHDPGCPEIDQRNRLVDAIDLTTPDEYAASAVYREVMAPLGVHRMRLPRVLLCDGPSLLAWFGAFHDRPFDARQNRLLVRLAAAMQRRLRFERDLGGSTRTRAVLDAALEHLGAPAFIIEGSGRVIEANRSGREILDKRRAELADAVQAAFANQPSALALELTRVIAAGHGEHWLAIARAGSTDLRIAGAIDGASTRWALTARQREVLELVTRGISNTTIAAQLHISVRAVEFHVTAIFDRAGVDSRAALIAAVLGP